jgi:hypothetical protein
MPRTWRGQATEKPPKIRGPTYLETRGQAHLPHRQQGPQTSMGNWLKRESLKLSSRRSTARCGCCTPPLPERPPRAANACVSWANRPTSASTPTSMSTTQIRHRARARSSSQQQHCCGPCPLPRHPRRGICTTRRNAHRASGRARGRKLGIPHMLAGQRAGRRRHPGSRGVRPSGWRSGATRQPRSNAGQGADP